jgi:hypothetical protein
MEKLFKKFTVVKLVLLVVILIEGIQSLYLTYITGTEPEGWKTVLLMIISFFFGNEMSNEKKDNLYTSNET